MTVCMSGLQYVVTLRAHSKLLDPKAPRVFRKILEPPLISLHFSEQNDADLSANTDGNASYNPQTEPVQF